jgi:hypothetical protein
MWLTNKLSHRWCNLHISAARIVIRVKSYDLAFLCYLGACPPICKHLLIWVYWVVVIIKQHELL